MIGRKIELKSVKVIIIPKHKHILSILWGSNPKYHKQIWVDPNLPDAYKKGCVVKNSEIFEEITNIFSQLFL